MKYAILSSLICATACLAADTNVNITVNGEPKLVLTVPSDARITKTNGTMEITTKDLDLYLFDVPDAKTLDEGLANIPQVIKHEVVEFVGVRTNSLTVAGAPAKHVIGRGVEADDRDPGTADVVIFQADASIFAACVHGEGPRAREERKPMLNLLKTARLPQAQR